MGPPVRVVCLDCLQSIEVSVSGTTSQPDSCPHCGCYLDPFQQGIESQGEGEPASSITLDLSNASTIRSETRLSGGVGRAIGRFQIRMVLGEGGYGQVFRAFDPHLEREVALKVLKSNRLGEKALQRFYREARAAARLDHPNIVALYDAGRDDGRCWIAYQLIAGRTLSALRDHTRLSVLESIRIVRDLALGLSHAHGRGVFHRDLKPANVIIDEAGRPRLTDFGLARRDDVASDLTTEGTVLGTPQYMSPEAAAGRAHEADARSDVYSLGVILYELLCGRRPCDLPSGVPLWRTLNQTAPPTPRSIDRAIPPVLDRICMKALALDPADRYADAGLLAEALTAQLGKIRPPRPPRRPIAALARVARPARRFGLAAASTACLGVVAALLLVRPRPTPDGPADPPPRAADAAGLPPPAAAPIRPTSLIAAPDGADADPVASPPPRPAAGAEVPPAPPADAPTGKPAADPRGAPPLVGNPDKHTYHYSGDRACTRLMKKRVPLWSTAEATDAGLAPCKLCRPDRYGAPESPAPAR